MAIYDNLPVFKQAYDLLLQILRFTSSVQRDFRYTVGETLKKDVIELCLCIYRANASVEKLPQIEAARERMVSIKLMVRVLHDMKQISTKQFALTCERMESVSKQLAAWQKYMAKDKSAGGRRGKACRSLSDKMNMDRMIMVNVEDGSDGPGVPAGQGSRQSGS